MPSFCVIGHVTRDTIYRDTIAVTRSFGGAIYPSVFLAGTGRDVALCTSLPADAERALNTLCPQIRSNIQRSPVSTQLMIDYRRIAADAANDRRISVKRRAVSINLTEIIDADWYLLCPHLSEDITPKAYERVAKSGAQWAADIQGLVRGPDGRDCRPDSLPALLGQARVLKASREELKLFTGAMNYRLAAVALSQIGPEVLVSNGEGGAEVFVNGQEYFAPAVFVPRVIDTTGCGDILWAAYCAARAEQLSPLASLQYATAAAAVKAATSGPHAALQLFRDTRTSHQVPATDGGPSLNEFRQ